VADGIKFCMVCGGNISQQQALSSINYLDIDLSKQLALTREQTVHQLEGLVEGKLDLLKEAMIREFGKEVNKKLRELKKEGDEVLQPIISRLKAPFELKLRNMETSIRDEVEQELRRTFQSNLGDKEALIRQQLENEYSTRAKELEQTVRKDVESKQQELLAGASGDLKELEENLRHDYDLKLENLKIEIMEQVKREADKKVRGKIDKRREQLINELEFKMKKDEVELRERFEAEVSEFENELMDEMELELQEQVGRQGSHMEDEFRMKMKAEFANRLQLKLKQSQVLQELEIREFEKKKQAVERDEKRSKWLAYQRSMRSEPSGPSTNPSPMGDSSAAQVEVEVEVSSTPKSVLASKAEKAASALNALAGGQAPTLIPKTGVGNLSPKGLTPRLGLVPKTSEPAPPPTFHRPTYEAGPPPKISRPTVEVPPPPMAAQRPMGSPPMGGPPVGPPMNRGPPGRGGPPPPVMGRLPPPPQRGPPRRMPPRGNLAQR